MRSWSKILVILITSINLVSCGASKNIVQEILPEEQDDRLVAVIDSISKCRPDFLSTRIDTKYSDNKQNQSFKISLKLAKNEAVHALMTFAGLPIITAMVTPDSVKLSNKKDKCYMLQSVNFFKDQFGIDFSFQNVEELLLGRPLNYNPSSKYYRVEDPSNYIIANQRKLENQGKLLIAYYLTPDLKNIGKVEISSFVDDVFITVNYPEYYNDEVFNAPKTIEASIKTKKNKINLLMNYDKVELNTPKEMIIVIPESYVKCK